MNMVIEIPASEGGSMVHNSNSMHAIEPIFEPYEVEDLRSATNQKLSKNID